MAVSGVLRSCSSTRSLGDGQLVGDANCRRMDAVFFGTVRGVLLLLAVGSRGDAVAERVGDESSRDGMLFADAAAFVCGMCALKADE